MTRQDMILPGGITLDRALEIATQALSVLPPDEPPQGVAGSADVRSLRRLRDAADSPLPPIAHVGRPRALERRSIELGAAH